MSVVTVVVPDGLSGGDTMVVDFNGTPEVIVPNGCITGSAIDVELPTAQVHDSPEMEVTVPDGVTAGDMIMISAGGDDFEVCVPRGCSSGMVFSVCIPKGPLQEVEQQGESSSAVAQDAGVYRIGQRVQVLRSSGEYSTAFVVDYHAPSGLYKVELFEHGSGVFKEGVTEDDIGSSWEMLYVPTSSRRQYESASSSTSESSSSDSDGEPPPGAPPWARRRFYKPHKQTTRGPSVTQQSSEPARPVGSS